MDHLDLVLKWISLRLCEKENTQALMQASSQAGHDPGALRGGAVGGNLVCHMILPVLQP